MKITSLLENFVSPPKLRERTDYYLMKEYQLMLEVGLTGNNLLSEGSEEKKQEVLRLIQSDTWESDPKEFHKAFLKSKHPLMLTPYTVQEFSEMKLFKVPGHDIGFALKKREDGSFTEIVAVYNNDPEVRGVGDQLVQAAIKHGGRYLDHYDGTLSDLYSKNGFIEYNRYTFDPAYDAEGKFQKSYGTPDIIYRHHKSVPAPQEPSENDEENNETIY